MLLENNFNYLGVLGNLLSNYSGETNLSCFVTFTEL